MKVHQFALYYEDLSAQADKKSILISDAELMHRIVDVLRLSTHETIVLFDSQTHIVGKIIGHAKKRLELEIVSLKANRILVPHITWLLPLLEREQWETALYNLAVMGVQTIVPIKMAHSKVTWGSAKDYERAKRIMIAACEQAKQFIIPVLESVSQLSTALTAHNDVCTKIYFDAAGLHIKNFLQQELLERVLCITGPEAGFAESEISLLQQAQFQAVALTPTILKASTAVTVGAGMLRAWYSKAQ